jgi:hypothetical protein
MTSAEAWADCQRLRRNLARLGQVAAIARRGFEAHNTTCPDVNAPADRIHADCAARLQTLDGDAPIAPYTVGRDLGHSGDALVRRIYAHLGTVRHRAKVVEYPTERLTLKVGRRMFAIRAANIENRRTA